MWRHHSSRRSRSLTSLVGGVHFLNDRDRLQDNSEHITFTATASTASCACYSKCDDNENTKSGIDTRCTKRKIWTYAAVGQLHNAQYDASGFQLGMHLTHPLPLRRCNVSALCCQKTLPCCGGCTRSRSARLEKSVDKSRVQVNNMTAGIITSFNLLPAIPLWLEIKLCYDEIMDKHTSLYLSKI